VFGCFISHQKSVMRIYTTLPAIVFGVLLTGCAGSNEPLALSLNHPANSMAAEAPHAATSTTLSLANTPTGVASTGHEGHGDHRAAIGATPATSPATVMYACPMHPEVTSANPNDKCPKCGMKINKPIKAAPGPAAAPLTPALGSPAPAHQHNHGDH
jgi:hypothetical protein